MKAERTARASRTRTPAAVVPAGEVTWARRTAGSSPVSAINFADPSMVSTTSVWLTSRGEAHLDPGLDQRLCHEEEIGGAGSRKAGHGIEQALG